MGIGPLLKLNRQKLGMTLTELSEKSGVPSSTISFYELERMVPSLYRLDALLKALDVSITIGKGNTDF